jgi:hypothetical protein
MWYTEVQLSFFHATKVCGGVELIWALDGGEWLASRPGRFTVRERPPSVYKLGDSVVPRVV